MLPLLVEVSLMVDKINIYWKSIVFVVVQFLSLGLIGLTGPIFPQSIILLAIELIGIGLGVWAVLVMRIGNFNIAPDPLQTSVLVNRGPYQMVRHPMYLALLLTTLPLVINYFSFFRIMVWFALLVNLLLKLNYEEGLLLEELDGYNKYTRESYRIIPFLY
jgi:protein-S-isoprenylcysteine O-methyltransferase Ste14